MLVHDLHMQTPVYGLLLRVAIIMLAADAMLHKVPAFFFQRCWAPSTHAAAVRVGHYTYTSPWGSPQRARHVAWD
jgi:hypothetical protein